MYIRAVALFAEKLIIALWSLGFSYFNKWLILSIFTMSIHHSGLISYANVYTGLMPHLPSPILIPFLQSAASNNRFCYFIKVFCSSEQPWQRDFAKEWPSLLLFSCFSSLGKKYGMFSSQVALI